MKAGWEVKTLGDLAEVITKGTTPTSIGHAFTDSGVNFIKIESISERGEFLPHKFGFISDAAHRDLGRSQLQAGDVLFSIAGALGRTAIVTPAVLPANTNQALSLVRLKVDAPLDRYFLQYFLRSTSILDEIERVRGGAAQQNLSLAQVRDFPIPLPPLDEQKRIVEVLDAAFEGLSRARAHTETNLQNARELFEAAVGKAFDKATAAENGWKIRALAAVSKLEYGYTESASREPVGPKFLRITDIQEGTVDWPSVPYCPISGADFHKYRLQPGDLVFARTGATTGKSFLIAEVADAVFASYLIRLRTTEGDLTPNFLAYFFQSDEYWEEVRKGTEGAAQGGFNASKLGAMMVPIPPIKTQGQIVAVLDEQFENSKLLQSHYRAKLADLEALRQSLLQKAFAGELT